MTSARRPSPVRESPPTSSERSDDTHQRGAERGGASRTSPAQSTGQNRPGRRGLVFLGNTTKLPSPSESARDAEKRKLRRRSRFALRETLGAISTLPRVAACGRCRVSKQDQPTVRVQGDDGGRIAHFTGVQLCGAVHTCPVCSPRIRQARADDIDAAAQTWLEEHGAGSLMLLSLTLPHDYGEPLADLLRTVRGAFGAMISGKSWQADKGRFHLAFYIVAHDTTVGVNGWHPHLHVLLFGRAKLSDDDVTALEDRLYDRWARAVARRGHRRPSRANGITLERARTRKDVARYVAQVVAGDDDDAKSKPVALEMARGDLKTSRMLGHRTPWQVLAEIGERRAIDGEWAPADDAADDRDVTLWREWEKATKGVPAIRWARGLRAAVGMAGAEKTDAEIVAEEVGGVDVFQFPDDDSWRAVSMSRGGRALVLAAAERGGVIAARAAVLTILERWRVRRREPTTLSAIGPTALPFPFSKTGNA